MKLTAVALFASLACAAPTKRRVSDTHILNFALAFEHLQTDFFTQALARFSESDFAASGQPAWVRGRLQQMHGHDSTHVTFLTTALKTAGASAIERCEFSFSFSDPSTFLDHAAAMKTVTAAALNGAIRLVDNRDYATVVSSMTAVQARHASWINAVARHGSPWTTAFEPTLGPSQAFSMLAPFIKSCPSSTAAILPGLQQYPTLTLGAVRPGQPVSVSFSAPDAPKRQLFAAFVSGLAQPVFVPLEEGNTQFVAPKDVFGYNFVMITSDGGVADDRSTVAGPVLMELPFNAEGQPQHESDSTCHWPRFLPSATTTDTIQPAPPDLIPPNYRFVVPAFFTVAASTLLRSMAAPANSNSRVVVKRVHASKIALKLQVAASAHAKLATSRPAQNGGVAASWQCFLVKLFRLLDDADNAKLISWDESGTSIIVFDATKPSLDRVLVLSGCGFDGVKTPMANFSSVLSKYGFKQQALTFKPGARKRAEKIQFTHAYILRDTPLLDIRALSMREAYRLGKGAGRPPPAIPPIAAAITGSYPPPHIEHPPVAMMLTPTKVPSSVHSHNDTGVGSPHSAINDSNAYTYSPGYTMDSLKDMPPPPGVDIGIGTIKDEELKVGIQSNINLHWQAQMSPPEVYGDAGAHSSDLSVYEVQLTPWLNLSPPTFGLMETVTEPTPPAIGGSDTVTELRVHLMGIKDTPRDDYGMSWCDCRCVRALDGVVFVMFSGLMSLEMSLGATGLVGVGCGVGGAVVSGESGGRVADGDSGVEAH
ncbi:hypothetical protein MKEN_00956600 [Mycena kentingensis (nom. inval.)]|nr:hypothetical protein MKEN_00956600 [Mycena kentingensis (nom. inval.)]